MTTLEKKRGGILPTVLIAAIILQLLFTSSLQLYRNRFYTYHLLINHYQSQALLALSEHRLTHENERHRLTEPRVMQYNIGHVSFANMDGKNGKLTSRLLNGYTEEYTFQFPDANQHNPLE